MKKKIFKNKKKDVEHVDDKVVSLYSIHVIKKTLHFAHRIYILCNFRIFRNHVKILSRVAYEFIQFRNTLYLYLNSIRFVD